MIRLPSGKIRLAVLFGGVSTEYEVSLESTTSIMEQIDQNRYEITMVGITKTGRWLLYNGPIEKLRTDTWADGGEVTPAALSPDRTVKGLCLFKESGVETREIDVVFPVLHGRNGEDGTVQGLCELAGIACVGAGAMSSGICMDKAVANTLFEHAGIRQAGFAVVREEELQAFSALETALKGKLGYPMFVKPANAGSSVGVSKAKNAEELLPALKRAFKIDSKVVVEEAVSGMEVECAVLGNESPVASLPGELISNNEFYDYNAKYIDNATEFFIPARLPAEVQEEVRRVAVQAYRALSCEGMARVDFFVRTSDGAVFLNEINTIPGFTTISMYPKLMVEGGMSYTKLIDELVDLAIERGRRMAAKEILGDV